MSTIFRIRQLIVDIQDFRELGSTDKFTIIVNKISQHEHPRKRINDRKSVLFNCVKILFQFFTSFKVRDNWIFFQVMRMQLHVYVNLLHIFVENVSCFCQIWSILYSISIWTGCISSERWLICKTFHNFFGVVIWISIKYHFRLFLEAIRTLKFD